VTTTGEDGGRPRRSRIAHRTAQLDTPSQLLHRVDHLASLSSVALAVVVLLLGSIIVGAVLDFPKGWVDAFQVTASAITLFMVFSIQHTQEREQVATQRKLDELIRAMPGASEKLMMLDEAHSDVVQEVEERHRDVRSGSTREEWRADRPEPSSSPEGLGLH